VSPAYPEGLDSGKRIPPDASLIEADSNKHNSTPKNDRDYNALNRNAAPRAAREYLDVLDDAAFGVASPVEPKITSHSDPSSQCLSAIAGHSPAAIDCGAQQNNAGQNQNILAEIRKKLEIGI
jgi:hypothetical protein